MVTFKEESHLLTRLVAMMTGQESVAPVEREKDVAGALHFLQNVEAGLDEPIGLRFTRGMVKNSEQTDANGSTALPSGRRSEANSAFCTAVSGEHARPIKSNSLRKSSLLRRLRW